MAAGREWVASHQAHCDAAVNELTAYQVGKLRPQAVFAPAECPCSTMLACDGVEMSEVSALGSDYGANVIRVLGTVLSPTEVPVSRAGLNHMPP